jgi:hypothetical protein
MDILANPAPATKSKTVKPLEELPLPGVFRIQRTPATSPTVVHLTGPAARGVRVGAPMLRDLLDALVDAVQQSVRMRAEGRSRAGGPIPAWLDRAATFVVEIQAGSTQLVRPL